MNPVDDLVKTCVACGFPMHTLEVSCLNCSLLADWQEQQLKAYAARRMRANMEAAAKAAES